MTATETTPGRIAPTLRTLYFARFAFALVWAGVLLISGAGAGGDIGGVGVALLLLYPLVDLAAAVIDRRASHGQGSAALLIVNMALSALAVIGLAVALAAGAGTGAVLGIWGGWAITAGAVQLAVGIARRGYAGHWPMILSGGISVLAGAGFVAQSMGMAAMLSGIAGYATLGGVFFLVSAIRLQLSLRRAAA
ncbi:hypothetical protein [Frondihabitans australicus]|uniref:Integral membrane protein n=1 Tax=Frondihabitans australicus TaxID=386892 RepID=A0A495IJD2_9MICO|nr:hypothetical protein [Frondihabitans australicus]RKR75235.1 hypothetical protein C8E83_2373 [Frondihabitans australicus]